jgi:hypothetical protein
MLDAWEPFLLRESRLPGPRANLELVQVVADEGTRDRFLSWLEMPEEFLALCGAVGLGRLIAEGQAELVDDLRRHASDRRWRVREGVAVGLQRVGARDMQQLLGLMRTWSQGNWLERRAVVAALCEPALLHDAGSAYSVLLLLDQITQDVATASTRDESFRVLRQALGYGWSVAIAAAPQPGKALFDKWLDSEDPDVRWIARENLKKARLNRIYPIRTASPS